MRSFACLAALLLVPVSVVAQQQRTGRVRSVDFVEWVSEEAVRLDSLDPSEIDPGAFDFLDDALQGKRIVYLGEMDHFVAERMEFRLVMISELMRRGYRRIGMEMGLSDAKRMDRFLETGDETWLERVALYGYRADMREDRVDEVAGWTDDSHPEFTQTVIDEASWFLRELRKINEALPEGEPRLSWFGYDLSFRPGGGYADARELLAPHSEEPLILEVRQRMARVRGESRLEEAARLEALVGMIDARHAEVVSMLGEHGTLELCRSLQRMVDAFRFIDSLRRIEDFDPIAIADAQRGREERMAHNFEEYLAEWDPNEKIILLGHALHLSKDSQSIKTQAYGTMWPTVGTFLERKLPGQVYAIWLLHHRGRHGLPNGEPTVQPFISPQDSVERRLTRVHPILVLPLHSGDPREAWLSQERVFSFSGAPARAVIPDQVDCLFFTAFAREPGQRRGAVRESTR